VRRQEFPELRIFLPEALVLPERGMEFHLVFPPIAHAKLLYLTSLAPRRTAHRKSAQRLFQAAIGPTDFRNSGGRRRFATAIYLNISICQLDMFKHIDGCIYDV